MTRRPPLLSLCFASLLPATASGELVDVPDLGLRIAPGFEITRYADHKLAPNIYSMTIDPDGAVVVSGHAYIKRLFDRDGDGVADSGAFIRDGGPGAMGMLFLDKTTLLASEGGKLNRYTDSDGDGVIDVPAETLAQFGGGEHGLHAIRRDAAGAIYIIGGNDAKFPGHPAISPGVFPKIEGGALIRLAPDLRSGTALAIGFRNSYDFDFDSSGEAFTYDSDCEREFFLPWYSPTRLYRVEPYAHHGWRLTGWKRGWKRPDYYFDSVRPLVNVGRGSPTGVSCYRHTAFPEHYHDGVFYLDWTFGKIFFTAAREPGALGDAVAEVFIESMGTNGFAPTDIEVAGDGSLFLTMGGRGTSGSVFHVRAKRPAADAKAIPLPAQTAFDRDAPDVEGLLATLGSAMELRADTFSPEAATLLAGELDKSYLTETAEKRLLLLRMLMVALGDWNMQKPGREAFTGYELSSDGVFAEEHQKLLILCRNTPRELLHSLDPDERREAARLLAMLRDPHPITVGRLLDAITADSAPEEDLHYLVCLACVASPLAGAELRRTAKALCGLADKLGGRQLRSKQTYPDRLNEVVGKLAERAPIYEELLRARGFAHPDHAGLAASFPEKFAVPVADLFLEAVSSGKHSSWREDVIKLLAGASSEKLTETLRHVAADPLLRDACVRILACSPDEMDRELYFASAVSLRKDVAAAALGALAKLDPGGQAHELLPLFKAADRERSLPLIRRAARQDFADREAAEAWLKKAFPEAATAAGIGASGEETDWPALFASVDWDAGDSERGAALFAARACAACHASANPLGPDLAGAAKRLSPADLFIAIAQPNADVPEAYRATVFAMRDGARHFGRVAFTSADGVIVQSADGSTLRLDEAEILAQEPWSRSLMPEGLLFGINKKQLADLYAYLKTL